MPNTMKEYMTPGTRGKKAKSKPTAKRRPVDGGSATADRERMPIGFAGKGMGHTMSSMLSRR